MNLRAEIQDRRYIDNVDLYSARSRAVFASNLSGLAGLDLSRVERDLETILDSLEAERDARLAAAEHEPVTMSEENRTLGMAFLKDPSLVERVLADLDKLGYVGEEENKLLVYLAATSRRMDDPISVLILSVHLGKEPSHRDGEAAHAAGGGHSHHEPLGTSAALPAGGRPATQVPGHGGGGPARSPWSTRSGRCSGAGSSPVW